MNANKTYLREYIEDRLREYGFGKDMNPAKYQAYSSARRIVSIRLGIEGRESLSLEQLNQAYELVDQILPAKEDKITMSRLLNLPLTQEEANVLLIQLGARIDAFHESLIEAGARGDPQRCMEITEHLKLMKTVQDKLQVIGARLEW